MTSTRLPRKVLLPLAGVPMVIRVVERASAIAGVDVVCVAVPDGEDHEPLVAAVAEHRPDAVVARGPENDVLRRTVGAADATGADLVVRVTSDCPYLDPDVSGAVLAAARTAGVPYARTAFRSGYPLGFDTEVVTTDALRAADAEAVDPYEREHATPFIWRRPERFPCLWLDHLPDRRDWRLVVDAPEDYELATRVYDELGPGFRFADLEELFAARPDLLEINRAVEQTRYVGIPGE